jgi:hypothetical protein
MRYKDFVHQIAELSQQSPALVREVLDAMPNVLLRLQEDEGVRTPIGILKMRRRKEKRVKIPKTEKWASAPEQLRIKLQPHKDLCISAPPMTDADKSRRKRKPKKKSDA